MGSKRLDALGALQLLVINPQQNRTMNEAAMSSTVRQRYGGKFAGNAALLFQLPIDAATGCVSTAVVQAGRVFICTSCSGRRYCQLEWRAFHRISRSSHFSTC